MNFVLASPLSYSLHGVQSEKKKSVAGGDGWKGTMHEWF